MTKTLPGIRICAVRLLAVQALWCWTIVFLLSSLLLHCAFIMLICERKSSTGTLRQPIPTELVAPLSGICPCEQMEKSIWIILWHWIINLISWDSDNMQLLQDDKDIVHRQRFLCIHCLQNCPNVCMTLLKIHGSSSTMALRSWSLNGLEAANISLQMLKKLISFMCLLWSIAFHTVESLIPVSQEQSSLHCIANFWFYNVLLPGSRI